MTQTGSVRLLDGVGEAQGDTKKRRRKAHQHSLSDMAEVMGEGLSFRENSAGILSPCFHSPPHSSDFFFRARDGVICYCVTFGPWEVLSRERKVNLSERREIQRSDVRVKVGGA